MKAYQREVTVEIRADGSPRQLYWEGRAYPVQVVLDRWRAGGRWWQGEEIRDCYLVQAGPLVAELHREAVSGGTWWLARLQD
ncbi:DUF6504 family protein [Deinococcus ficus]|uniref:DUF6504 family protein n=1 Tax=Deinococcus ficus TaxID=317577 RepID=UPI0003B3B2B9|nr:DUF6504 family protein [Deinococcus ficus]